MKDIIPALSVRQPWASWIVHGMGYRYGDEHKDVENRTWSTPIRIESNTSQAS